MNASDAIKHMTSGGQVSVEKPNGITGIIEVEESYGDGVLFFAIRITGGWSAGVVEPICEVSSPFIRKFLEGAIIHEQKQCH